MLKQTYFFYIHQHLGPEGRMLAASKSQYRQEHPEDLVLFNAYVCTENEVLWCGDFNASKTLLEVVALSKSLNLPLYLLPEMDVRMDKTFDPQKAVLMILKDYLALGPAYQNAWQISGYELRLRN